MLKVVGQLSPPELERFVADVLRLQAHQAAPRLSSSEAELLGQINQGLPEGVRRRDDDLVAKRRGRTLTPDEHAELIALTEEVEAQDARRLGTLAELARLRGTTLSALMKDLGIPAPSDG